jgi:hypothetical protein
VIQTDKQYFYNEYFCCSVNYINIVTHEPIARQRPGKHIPMEENVPNNRMSIARPRISKHASLTIEAVFSAWSVQSGYRELFGSIEQYRTVRLL